MWLAKQDYMEINGKKRGSLSIEASISFSAFVLVVVTVLYIMRIVYLYGLVQHAAAQTAKELSMYSYIYQVAGVSDLNQSVQNGTKTRTAQFNSDLGEVVSMYENLIQLKDPGRYEGTTNPKEILKNIGAVLVGEAGQEVNNRLIEVCVRPMMAGYIGADSNGNSADGRLKLLRVEEGMAGLDFSSSSFFKDGVTIDLVVCYTVDPLFPLDFVPEMNVVNRAYVRGMSGKNIFTGTSRQASSSVWDMENDLERGRAIQEQEGTRNLPDNFSTFSSFDESTGTATAERSIDLRENTYQDINAIRGRIEKKLSQIDNYRTTTYDGYTLDAKDIRKNVLIIYIPSSTKDRDIDRSKYDEAVRQAHARYPHIQIITKEID